MNQNVESIYRNTENINRFCKVTKFIRERKFFNKTMIAQLDVHVE